VETNSHSVFPATQALKSNKDTIDELEEKLKKAEEDASGECGYEDEAVAQCT